LNISPIGYNSFKGNVTLNQEKISKEIGLIYRHNPSYHAQCISENINLLKNTLSNDTPYWKNYLLDFNVFTQEAKEKKRFISQEQIDMGINPYEIRKYVTKASVRVKDLDTGKEYKSLFRLGKVLPDSKKIHYIASENAITEKGFNKISKRILEDSNND